MCEANSWISCSVRGGRESSDRTFCDSDALSLPLCKQRVETAESERANQPRGEFDPGSGRTLAACLTHASHGGPQGQPANGCVTREQPTEMRGIAGPTAG